MLSLKTLGFVTQPRTAIAFVAATLLIGGTATEASAKSRHHRYHHHHRHHAQTDTGSDWRNANAAMTPSSGTGHSFSGMASFYGNESGSKTASGQRLCTQNHQSSGRARMRSSRKALISRTPCARSAAGSSR